MAAVTFKLNRPKKDGKLKTTAVSVVARFYDKQTGLIEITTGEKIIPKYWTGSAASSKMKGHVEFNQSLLNIETSIIQLWRDNKDDLSKIKSLIPSVVRGSSSTSQKKTIFEALDKFLKECESGKGLNTLKMYRSLQGKLTEFDKLYSIDFANLDFNFYDRFKRWLYEQPNPNYTGCSLYLSDSKDCYLISNDTRGIPVGLFDDTVFKYFTNLKAFLSWSEKRGYQTHPSYKTWEIIKRRPDPISLTLDELEKLERAPMSSKSLDIARDYLVLECRTGQRISDLKRFDVLDYSDQKWTHHPKKGNRLSAKKVSVHFKGYCAPALLILGKYNFKLPTVHEVTLNKNIKEACKIAGINSDIFTDRWAGNKKIRISGPKYSFISTHNGRATFITLALSHGMPVEYVMELTGISEYQTLSHYRAKFDDKSVEKYLEGVSEQISLLRKSS
jgi:site-specific recombinase XerD